MDDLYARVKPYDPKRDHVMKVYVLGYQRFDAGKWVPVNRASAGALTAIHQSYYDEKSPLAFDVCTLEQAMALGYKPADGPPNGEKERAPSEEAETPNPPPADGSSSAGRGRKKDA